MSLDKLSADAIESGKEHPFVQALLRELKVRLINTEQVLRNEAGHGDVSHQRLCQLGGRAAELWAVIRLIDETKGG